jgi:hypothetical protein
MTKAIKCDRYKLVNFLLEYGFSLNAYLTPIMLLEFYKHVNFQVKYIKNLFLASLF